MRVLVTGATGFVGSHVVAQLVERGHQVRALVRVRTATLPPGAERVSGDLLDAPSLARAADGCDAVIHTAAMITFRRREFGRQREVNVQGTRNLVEAARGAGVKRLVHTSSVAAVGRPAGDIGDEHTRYDWPVGCNYHETKRDAEAIVRQARDLETVCLNPALILGPGEVYHHYLPLFRAVSRGLVRIATPGATTLCDVRDVAAAHVSALHHGTSGERYILGGPHLTHVELAGLIADAVGAPRPRAVLPDLALRVGALPLIAAERLGFPLPYSPSYATMLRSRALYASDRATAELAYRPRDAASTINDMARWYRTQSLL